MSSIGVVGLETDLGQVRLGLGLGLLVGLGVDALDLVSGRSLGFVISMGVSGLDLGLEGLGGLDECLEGGVDLGLEGLAGLDDCREGGLDLRPAPCGVLTLSGSLAESVYTIFNGQAHYYCLQQMAYLSKHC